jgi:hypothetical protein
MTTWDRVVREVGVDEITPRLLRGLIDGEHAVIVLKGLVDDKSFSANGERLKGLFEKAATTEYANGTLTTIGPYLAKYLARTEDYFVEADKARAWSAEASFDLASLVRERLREVFSLTSFEVMREPDGQRYADSVVRIHADGVRNPLHNDNIMRDAAGTSLRVSGLKYQLSCVVCVQECDEGGELRTYAKPWRLVDEEFKIRDGLGYDNEVVRGVPVHEFKPQSRDVYLINPTYFHEIERVGGADRVTLGFFFGFNDDELDTAVAWG